MVNTRMVDAMGPAEERRRRLDLTQQRKMIKPRVRPVPQVRRTPASMDGVRSQRARSVQVVRRQPQPRAEAVATPRARLRGRWRFGWYALLAVIGLLVLGYSVQTLGFGEAVIGGYLLLAFWWQWPSRAAFIAAMACLLVVVADEMIEGSGAYIGDNFGVYAFLLLGVGTILLGLEVRRQDRSGRRVDVGSA